MEGCVIKHQNLSQITCSITWKEEGTTTTPFDMTVLNQLNRFHLVGDVVERVKNLGSFKRAYLKQLMRDKLIEHKQYINEHGQDMPEIREWSWKRKK